MIQSPVPAAPEALYDLPEQPAPWASLSQSWEPAVPDRHDADHRLSSSHQNSAAHGLHADQS